MRIRSKLKSAELDMTPMIDVVFLLIVFFILVINFTAADQDERIKLPVSELAQPPDQPPHEQLTLHVLSDGHVIYGGTEYPLSGLYEKIDERVRLLKFMNVPPEKITVIVRGDALNESGNVLDVIELCQKVNLSRFVVRAKQREE